MAKTAPEVLTEEEARFNEEYTNVFSTAKSFTELLARFREEADKGTAAYMADEECDKLPYHTAKALQMNNAATVRMIQLLAEKEKDDA